MKRVTRKDIEKAIALTSDRWIRIGRAKTIRGMGRVIATSECGFCLLDRALSMFSKCMVYKCPVYQRGCNCCKAWESYALCGDIPPIHREAKALIKRMDNFDIPAIVRTINKAIKEAEA